MTCVTQVTQHSLGVLTGSGLASGLETEKVPLNLTEVILAQGSPVNTSPSCVNVKARPPAT